MRHSSRFPRLLAIGALVGALALSGCTTTFAFLGSSSLDGPGVGRPRATTQPIAGGVSAVTIGGVPHVFYRTNVGNLRHSWLYDKASGTWGFETIDGPNGQSSTKGKTTNSVGSFTSVSVYNGVPHVFYYDETAGRLRHAFFNFTAWVAEYLDPQTGVGTYTSTGVWNNQLHVFYRDEANGRLRHGWWDPVFGVWGFEDLDGPGVGGGNGRTGNSVGTYTSTFILQSPHAVYYDDTDKNLRHAFWAGTAWKFETVDGASNSLSGQVGDVGSHTNANPEGNGSRVRVSYYDAGGGALRTITAQQSGWGGLGVVDGGPEGLFPVDNLNAGQSPAAAWVFDTPYIWYYDVTNGKLRQAKPSTNPFAPGWERAIIDGINSLNGQVPGNVGQSTAATEVQVDGRTTVAYVFSWNATAGLLRMYQVQGQGPPPPPDLSALLGLLG